MTAHTRHCMQEQHYTLSRLLTNFLHISMVRTNGVAGSHAEEVLQWQAAQHRPCKHIAGVHCISRDREGINSCFACLQYQPPELYAGCATIEYQMPAGNVLPPAYVFIIDTSVAEDELRACVASLTQALTTLPEYTQVLPLLVCCSMGHTEGRVPVSQPSEHTQPGFATFPFLVCVSKTMSF